MKKAQPASMRKPAQRFARIGFRTRELETYFGVLTMKFSPGTSLTNLPRFPPNAAGIFQGWPVYRKRKDSTMKHLASSLALVLLATPALAQSVGEKTGINSTLGIAPTTADFVKEAATSDMFEIQSSQIAQERGNASEKTFAATMIRDHQKTSDDLKSMIVNGDVRAELPTVLDSSHQSEIDKLKSLKGADFSSRYDSDQLSGHKDAVSLFERYAKDGDDLKLKDWADKTLPTLRHHLAMAEELTAGKTVGSH
jgi:putative membrane protein